MLSTQLMKVHVDWTVSRKTDVKESTGITKSRRDISLPALINGELNPTRKSIAQMLDGNSTSANATINLRNAFPKFIKVTSLTTSVVSQLMNPLYSRK